MKANMSPQAVTARLKLVGELARVCLLLRQAKKQSDAKKTEKVHDKPDNNR